MQQSGSIIKIENSNNFFEHWRSHYYHSQERNKREEFERHHAGRKLQKKRSHTPASLLSVQTKNKHAGVCECFLRRGKIGEEEEYT